MSLSYAILSGEVWEVTCKNCGKKSLRDDGKPSRFYAHECDPKSKDRRKVRKERRYSDGEIK